MVSTSGIIYGSDYNAVQDKVVQVLGSGSPYGPGTGSPNYGYNQTVTSSAVSISAIITASQWQLLADDVNKIATHQTNASFSGYSASYVATGKQITAADLNTLDTNMNTYVTNRLTVNAAQLTSTASTYTRTTSWGANNTGIAQTGTFTFASANAVQYWFNQGGRVVWQGFFTSPTASAQDQNWKTGVQSFTYTLDITSYATLTSTPTQKYYATLTGPYSASFIRLDLSVSGGVFTYTVTYQDGHTPVPPGGSDSVSGTIGFTLTRFTSTGAVTGTAPTIGVNGGSTFV